MLPHDPPPDSLVSDGRYNFGTYNGPVPNLNQLDAPSRVPRAVRNLRLKEWEAFQIGNDEWFICGAVYSTKLLGILQIAAVYWPTGKLYRWIRRVPAWQLQVATGLSATTTTGRAGDLSVTLENQLPGRGVTVRAAHRGNDELPPMTLEIDASASGEDAAHLVICHPFSDTTALYSNKSVMPAEGTLTVGATTVDFDRDASFMILDDHKGEYPLPMDYDWVTGARIDEQGRRVAVNLTRNQVRDPERFNENAVFVDDRVYRLGAVRFSRPDGVNGTWRINDDAGDVDVRFHPDIANELHVGPRRALAEYFGPYGRLEGTIQTADERIDLAGFRGMGEKKLIRV